MPLFGKLYAYNKDVIMYPLDTLISSDSFDWQNLHQKVITVWNSGAALTNGVLMVSPDDTVWGTLTAIAGGTLGSATLWTYSAENGYKYWKFKATVGSGVGTLTLSFRA